jgi:hypothetical protein
MVIMDELVLQAKLVLKDFLVCPEGREAQELLGCQVALELQE